MQRRTFVQLACTAAPFAISTLSALEVAGNGERGAWETAEGGATRTAPSRISPHNWTWVNRHDLVIAAIGAIPVAAGAADEPNQQSGNEPKQLSADGLKAAVRAKPAEDRFGEPDKLAVGHIECTVSAMDTAGAMSIFEALTQKADRHARRRCAYSGRTA